MRESIWKPYEERTGSRITSQCCGRPRVASKVCLWYSVPWRVALAATDCHPLSGKGDFMPKILRGRISGRFGMERHTADDLYRWAEWFQWRIKDIDHHD